MSIASLEDLFVHTLEDVYFAENLLAKKLPEMAKKASASALQTAFEDHLAETKTHITRLDAVFKALGKQPKAEECPGIEGIIEEAEELLKDISNGKTRDAALIASAQAAEHYEITRYGTLIAWARELGHEDILFHLRETLAEEKNADNKLLRLGEDQINAKAA
jgi:ferritin-like metal-binding protein YciE